MSSGEIIPVLAIGGGLTLGAMGMIGSFIQNVLRSRSREQTRREVAAYVAEGSMTAEEGERLLQAGLTSSRKDRGGGCC